MRVCPTCDFQFEANYVFCPEDGTILATVHTSTAAWGSEAMPSARTGIETTSEHAVITEELPAKSSTKYCPACAGEYPLTFSSCPLDGLPLTQEGTHYLRSPAPSQDSAVSEGNTSRVLIDESGSAGQTPAENSAVPVVEYAEQPEAQQSEEIALSEANRQYACAPPAPAPDEVAPDRQYVKPTSPLVIPLAANDYVEDFPEYAFDSDQRGPFVSSLRPDRPSFRIAARATAIGLAIFALAALYTVYVNGSRRPAPPIASVNTEPNQNQPSLFIPTPPEARNYVEEQATLSPTRNEDEDRTGNRVPAGIADSTPKPASGAARTQVPQPSPVDSKQSSRTRQRRMEGTEASETQAATSTPRTLLQPVVSRSTEGRLNSRLVRVRGSKTASGYRYDLTFTLQEQAGRAVRWDQLAISTHSVSGVTHSQRIPFYHRLGAAGSLTFTVSVQMPGKSDADWHGRVVCTTSGSDDSGKPIRAVFGASM